MDQNKLSERVKNERERRGISRQELAEMLNVKTSTVWRWEKGKTVMKIKELAKIGFIFDLTISEIIGDTNGQENA